MKKKMSIMLVVMFLLTVVSSALILPIRSSDVHPVRMGKRDGLHGQHESLQAPPETEWSRTYGAYTQNEAFPMIQANDGPAAKWTFMVYLDADNNLEYHGINNFLNMSAVGSTDDVNIIVQMDRHPEHDARYDDWTGCKRYLITHNMTPTIANALQDLGEANMGDPNTLADFIVWGIQNYPADHYVVDLWDHGSGVLVLTRAFEQIKGVCFDETDWDALTTIELEEAFAIAANTTGVKVDVLGFDACLMGMIEVAYQIKDYADVMVASEAVEPAPGWPYYYVLSNLTSNPTMTSIELATEIVQDYISFYSDLTWHLFSEYATLSAVNLGLITYSSIDDLANATSNFAQKLLNRLPTCRNEIARARIQTQDYYQGGDPRTYVDLYHFARLVHTSTSYSDIQTAAEQVMNTLNDTVITEGHLSVHPNSHGLTIYFPRWTEDYSQLYNYSFTTDTQWDEFLEAYLPDVEGHFYEARLENLVDNDGDDWYGSVELRWDADTALDVLTLYVKIYGWWEEKGCEYFIGQTSPYVIYGKEPDWHSVILEDRPTGHWDYRLELYCGRNDTLLDLMSYEDPDITKVPMDDSDARRDIAVTNATTSKNMVEHGNFVYINVTVENQGDIRETFAVTVYYDSKAIETQPATLENGTSTTLTFTWDTTGITEGTYTISAYAYPVPRETDRDDNTLEGGLITILHRRTSRIYLDPSVTSFHGVLPPIGTLFNVTVRVNDVEDMYAFEVTMFYNGSIVDVTRWFPPIWDPEYVFYGMPSMPVFSRWDSSVSFGAALLGHEYPFTGSGILGILELNVTAVPPEGETYFCYLEIDNLDTFYWDPEMTKIYYDAYDNGYYEIRIYGVHDLAVTAVNPHETIICQGSNLQIDVTVQNQGSFTETFDVTVYTNTFIIATPQDITLTSGESTIVSSTWNTTGFAKGKYIISAHATPIPTETDATDNTLTDGVVKVTLPSHDIAITDVDCEAVVWKGYSVSIEVTLENWGSYGETFSVAVYANTFLVAVQVISLGESATTITFTWDTLGIAEGNYVITAKATPVPGETDTTDNSLIQVIFVVVPGDVNADGKVDMKDIGALCLHFGAEAGDPLYVPNYDVNCDGKIDMKDIGICCLHYGEENS